MKKIICNILKYFPQKLEYDSFAYKNSKEYLLYISKRNEASENSLYEKYLEKEIIKIFYDYNVSNWTDKEEYKCFEFRILLHKNVPILDDDINLIEYLSGLRYDLFLFISIIEKYSYFFINETVYDFKNKEWTFKKNNDFPIEIMSLLKQLNEFLSNEGYEQISEKVAMTILKDVETEYLNKNEVKIFNCLFTDLISV